MRQLQEVHQAWRRGVLRYYCSWIGAPQSKDMNASHGRRGELTNLIHKVSRQIYREGNANNKYFASKKNFFFLKQSMWEMRQDCDLQTINVVKQ
jgi:hypothetical protein